MALHSHTSQCRNTFSWLSYDAIVLPVKESEVVDIKQTKYTT